MYLLSKAVKNIKKCSERIILFYHISLHLSCFKDISKKLNIAKTNCVN